MTEKHYPQLGETIKTEVLENGLTVYVMPKTGYAKKYAFFATAYGGADRRFFLDGKWQDTPAGIAHFLEHKLFDTKDGNALADLAANGASPNAFTSAEMTAYYFECTDAFEENLKTLLEFVSVPYFTPESVEKEQGIIGQEIGMIADIPEYVVYYNLLKNLYANHPVRDSIAGTVESIAEITDQTLYDLHAAFYRPSNMVLCVVGDVDAEKVLEITKKILPSAFSERPKKDHGAAEEKMVVRPLTETQMEVSKPKFMAGTRVDGDYKGSVCLKLELAGVLALEYLLGKSSALYLRLYESGLIAKDFSTGFFLGQSHGYVEFGGESSDAKAVLEAIQKEIADITQKGKLDEARFTLVKKALYGKLRKALDDVEDICYALASSHFVEADALERAEILENIKSTDLLDFFGEHMRSEQFALSIITPNEQ